MLTYGPTCGAKSVGRKFPGRPTTNFTSPTVHGLMPEQSEVEVETVRRPGLVGDPEKSRAVTLPHWTIGVLCDARGAGVAVAVCGGGVGVGVLMATVATGLALLVVEEQAPSSAIASRLERSRRIKSPPAAQCRRPNVHEGSVASPKGGRRASALVGRINHFTALGDRAEGPISSRARLPTVAIPNANGADRMMDHRGHDGLAGQLLLVSALSEAKRRSAARRN